MVVIPESVFTLPEAELGELSELTAISPIDGRYAEITKPLRPYFSEFALIWSRVRVEIEFLKAMSAYGLIREMQPDEISQLDDIWENFSIDDAKNVKEIERTTRHDVKAMTYFLEGALKGSSVADLAEQVHFGLTSEDVSNLAMSLLIREAKNKVITPALWDTVDALAQRADEWKDVVILGRTHGRDALPTTLGKEMAIYAHRLAQKAVGISRLNLTGKLNGATGNYHELSFAEPDVDWIEFSENFVTSLGLEPNLYTTQIEPHDRWAELFHDMAEAMNILYSIDQNLWGYVSQDYLYLKPRTGQTGSSVMPHKGRNPIGIENSEGNTYIATLLYQGFAVELPNSRFQRHLSDTTITRNIGPAFAYSLISTANAISDINDFQIKPEGIHRDVVDRWAILSAAIQTRLRRLGVPDAYEMFDAMSKAGPITQEVLHEFIDRLEIPDEEKARMKALRSETHTGLAVELTNRALADISKMREENQQYLH